MGISFNNTLPAILRSLFLSAAFLLFFQGSGLPAAVAVAPSPSSPRLVGTVEGGPFTGAVFDDGTGVQAFYRLHQQLPDGSYIVKVRKDSIVIKKDDGLLYEMFTTGAANSAITAVPSPGLSPARTTPSAPDSGAPPIRPRGRIGRTPQPEE